jgi:hypothetical protein
VSCVVDVWELLTSFCRTDLISKNQMLYVKAEGHEHSEYHWSLRAPKALSFMLADKGRVQPSSDDPEP